MDAKARPSKREKPQGYEHVSLGRDAQLESEHRPIRVVIVGLIVVAVFLVSALVGFIVLSNTPVFTIASIDADPTEHLTAENIGKLANVEEGTTLLSMDEAAITQNLKRNPWVGSVSFVREFPDRLKIVITERRVDCVVKMSTGSVCWCLGDDNVWIEPMNLTVLDGQSAYDVALAFAQDLGALLITDVPASMSPSAGSVATDEVLLAIAAYRDQFSREFASQIACFSAASVESISCTLKSGVELSLGAPSNIEIKESVVGEILAKHPNQVTYINVRVPSQPSYRKVGTESVESGSGVVVDLNRGYNSPTPTQVSDSSTTGEGEQSDSGSEDEYSEDYGYDEEYDSEYDDSDYSYDDSSYDYSEWDAEE